MVLDCSFESSITARIVTDVSKASNKFKGDL